MSAVANVRAAACDGLTVAEVMHAGVTSMPASVTAGELRAWFADSASRRLAVIADGGRYIGSLTPADIGDGVGPETPALELARPRPTIAPQVPAGAGRDLAAATDARRVPVVDGAGRFGGVLALTTDLRRFACRPAPG